MLAFKNSQLFPFSAKYAAGHKFSKHQCIGLNGDGNILTGYQVEKTGLADICPPEKSDMQP